ncbi:MAG: hypothetical protein GY711_03850 [bacterium]|nr:hypothetical protein [bacterium]
MLHLVQGDREARGDLFYLRRAPGATEFSQPIRVNTTPGIVAGYDLAVGREGRVHVLSAISPETRSASRARGRSSPTAC